MSAATIEQQLRNLEKGYMELRAENQRLREALESAERALADAEKIITSHTAGSWAGSLNLAKVREALRSEQ